MNAITSPVTLATGNDPWFTAPEVSARYGVTPQTLANWRFAKRGPRYLAMSARAIRYRLSDLVAWEQSLAEPMADDKAVAR